MLPGGEDEGWLVTKRGSGWSKYDEIRVNYNPNDLAEKYIEGFEESPWSDVGVGAVGLVLRIGALLAAKASKTSDTVNDIIDTVDR